MKYRYIAKATPENYYLQTNDVVAISVGYIIELNRVEVFGPEWAKKIYQSWIGFNKEWQALTELEEKSVEYYENKYKKKLIPRFKIEMKLYEGPRVLVNGNYYNTTDMDQKAILDLLSGLWGHLTRGAKEVGGDKIYTVRSPFMSRMSQFEEGKQTLCIGLDMMALGKSDLYKCYLGKNKKTYYEIESKNAINLAKNYRSVWTNKAGRQVSILPLKDFKRVDVEVKEEKLVDPKFETEIKAEFKQENLI